MPEPNPENFKKTTRYLEIYWGLLYVNNINTQIPQLKKVSFDQGTTRK